MFIITFNLVCRTGIRAYAHQTSGTNPLATSMTCVEGSVEVVSHQAQCLFGPWIMFAFATCERMAVDTTRANTSKRVHVRIMRQRPAKTHRNNERQANSFSAQRRPMATAAFNWKFSGSTEAIEILRFPLTMLSVVSLKTFASRDCPKPRKYKQFETKKNCWWQRN